MKLNIYKKKEGGGRGSVIYYDVCDFLYKRIERIFLPFCQCDYNHLIIIDLLLAKVLFCFFYWQKFLFKLFFVYL